MDYLDGFLIPVPVAHKDRFVTYSHVSDATFVRNGALRILECWPEEVDGSGFGAPAAGIDRREGEVIAFSWIEWLDKTSQVRSMSALNAIMKTDPHFDPARNALPFDLSRVMWGCFQTLVERGYPTSSAYVRARVRVVPGARKEDCRLAAERSWEALRDCGALRLVETWEDGEPQGQQAASFQALKQSSSERLVFSFVEWPSRAVYDRASPRVDDALPGDTQVEDRLVLWGGYRPVVEANAEGPATSALDSC